MKRLLIIFCGCAIIGTTIYSLSVVYQKTDSKIHYEQNKKIQNMTIQELDAKVQSGELEKAVFSGGCFWCTEASYDDSFGVVQAMSGFFGGTLPNPTYEQHGDHREGVLVYFNTASTTYKKLLVNYWTHIDPTQDNGQFADIGSSYKTAIYYFSEDQKRYAEESKKILEDSKKFGDKKIAVEIIDGRPFTFYPAEEYHQNYADKNPVRYNYYKEGSGRAQFMQDHWYKDTTFNKFLESSDALSQSGSSGNKSSIQPWHTFTEEDKMERLTELSEVQVRVTQHEGTEKPFENEYDKNYEKGIYVDIVSGEPLFLSTNKFNSGTGWPSFVRPISEKNVTIKNDFRLFYTRSEVRSAVADSHLGHVFDDGPKDRGGKRYCMNSAALRFVPLDKMEEEGYGEFVSRVQ